MHLEKYTNLYSSVFKNSIHPCNLHPDQINRTYQHLEDTLDPLPVTTLPPKTSNCRAEFTILILYLNGI